MNNYFTSIGILNGFNFKKWKQDLQFSLGIVDLDMELRQNIHVINAYNTHEEKEKLAN